MIHGEVGLTLLNFLILFTVTEVFIKTLKCRKLQATLNSPHLTFGNNHLLQNVCSWLMKRTKFIQKTRDTKNIQRNKINNDHFKQEYKNIMVG